MLRRHSSLLLGCSRCCSNLKRPRPCGGGTPQQEYRVLLLCGGAKKEHSSSLVVPASTTATTIGERRRRTEPTPTHLHRNNIVASNNNSSNSNKGSDDESRRSLTKEEKETLTITLLKEQQSKKFDRQELLLFERLVNHHNHHREEECSKIIDDLDVSMLLNQIIMRWSSAWKEVKDNDRSSVYSTSTKKFRDDDADDEIPILPTPMRVLRWIDSLVDAQGKASAGTDVHHHVLLQPDADTYRYIMDAAISQYHRSIESESTTTTTTGTRSRRGKQQQKQQLHQSKSSAFHFIESLFQRILHCPNSDVTVDDFHRVMHACIYLNNNDVVSAERYLDELTKLYFLRRDESNNNRDLERLRPTNRTYDFILAGWARDNAPRQATECLFRMLDDGLVLPQRSNFETCLNAWVKCSISQSGKQGGKERDESLVAGERAENLLLRMQELHERSDGSIDAKPCMRHIGKVVTAWASAVPKRKDAAERAEAVLRFMQDLDWDKNNDDDESSESVRIISDAYLSIIRAYSHSASKNKNSPEKCQALMKDLKNEVGGVQNIPHAILRKLCSCLVLAWARSRRKDASKRAEATFHQIRQDCNSVGVEFRPDRFCYGSLLEVWSRHPDGERAEAIWNEMHRAYLDKNKEGGVQKNRGSEEILKPDTKSMNLVILAWGRSAGKNPDASRRAEEVFKEMTELHSIKPDVVTYNALLTALAGSRDDPEDVAHRGEEYFRQLNILFSRGDLSCRPTAVTYNQVIRLWSKVVSSKSIERAEDLVDEMIRRRLQPDEQTFQAFASVLESNGLRDKREHELRFKERWLRVHGHS